MAVFVDEIASGAFVLLADELEELHNLASSIGLANDVFKPSPPAIVPLYHLTEQQMKSAVKNGALDTTKSVKQYMLMEDCRKWWRLQTAKRIRDARL